MDADRSAGKPGTPAGDFRVVTERDRAAGRAGAPYPPFCADIGSLPIITRTVQMWEFCAARPSPACNHPGRA